LNYFFFDIEWMYNIRKIMRYTEELPNKEGYYWWKESGGKGEIISIKADRNKILWVYGEGGNEIPIKNLGGEFCGPLIEPEE